MGLRSGQAVKGRSCVYVAAAAAEVSPTRADTAAASGPNRIQIRLRQRAWRSICWERWELMMLAKEEEAMSSTDAGAVAEDLELLDGADAADVAGVDASAPYFSHWDSPSSHLSYLEDEALVGAFQEALTRDPDVVRDKVVLDLGCGPAHVSMLAAAAGAKRVYAVDGSAGAANMARAVVAANGLSGKITVIHSTAEALTLKEKVDVILSDACGPMLLGGGMLRALAAARTRWLKPNGVVLPDTARLHVTGVDDRDFLVDARDAWGGLRTGFDMGAALGQMVRMPRRDTLTRESAMFMTRAQVLTVGLDGRGSSEGGVGGDADTEQAVPLTVRAAARDGFVAPFSLTARREQRLFALMLWFDAGFNRLGGDGAGSVDRQPVLFSTDPARPATHQQQLLLNFPKSIRVGEGDEVAGMLAWRPSAADPRAVDVELSVEYQGVEATANYTVPAILPSN